jgi:hypothetical protein
MSSKSSTCTSLLVAWEEISPSFTLDDELENLLLMYLNSPEENIDSGRTCHRNTTMCETLPPPERFTRRRKPSQIVSDEVEIVIDAAAKTSPRQFEDEICAHFTSPGCPGEQIITIESQDEMDLAFDAINTQCY